MSDKKTSKSVSEPMPRKKTTLLPAPIQFEAKEKSFMEYTFAYLKPECVSTLKTPVGSMLFSKYDSLTIFKLPAEFHRELTMIIMKLFNSYKPEEELRNHQIPQLTEDRTLFVKCAQSMSIFTESGITNNAPVPVERTRLPMKGMPFGGRAALQIKGLKKDKDGVVSPMIQVVQILMLPDASVENPQQQQNNELKDCIL
jgi:hypothetical protein